MEDYGSAIFRLSKYREINLLKWESLAHPGHFHIFHKNKTVRLADGSTTDCYQCRNCDKPKKEEQGSKQVALLKNYAVKLCFENPNDNIYLYHFPICPHLKKMDDKLMVIV
uniref:Uncharacterized protein n=1 Tax=Romanomermis culicivorax TaxID=13658 RepID=A0A915JXQ8_ROMCU